VRDPVAPVEDDYEHEYDERLTAEYEHEFEDNALILLPFYFLLLTFAGFAASTPAQNWFGHR